VSEKTIRVPTSLTQTVANVIWERRWKILTTIGVYFLARSCEFAPPWAQGLCHLAAQVFKILP
jgi:hypothetical protein